VAHSTGIHEPEKHGASPHRTRNRWLIATGAVFLACLAACAIAAEYAIRNAEPTLRASVVDTLSSWFHSPVQLDELHISLPHGIQVSGRGLRILYLAGPSQPSQAQLLGAGKLTPMLSVDNFLFRISLHDLRRMNTRIARVYVEGLQLHIPPHTMNGLLTNQDPQVAIKTPRFHFTIGKVECKNAKVFIDPVPRPGQPAKDPLEFDIKSLELTDVGTGQPLLYSADVVNPRPTGIIHAFGHFGPWQGADPRATPIDGHYVFENADLSTIKGLRGILNGTGTFTGQLGHLTVDGSDSTPEFALDVSAHPIALTTTFHAFVDGTTGDTTLAPVHATLGHSQIIASGSIIRHHDPRGGEGHDITLTVDVPHGRIEDMLQLGMKTQPPILHGDVTVHASLHLPPGNTRVADKMQLAGKMSVLGVTFTNPKLQDRVDGLSMRAQGKPEEVHLASSDHRAEVDSQMDVDFNLASAMMTVNSMDFRIPGANVKMDGVYSLDGNVFEFKGYVRTDATASQMVTGWKAMLLKPFDGLLKKNGAGLQLPISVSGVKGDVRFGLAMHNPDESTKDIAADVKARRKAEATAAH
jgi:hypothetical protein